MARSRGKNGKSSTPMATTLLMPPKTTIRDLAEMRASTQEKTRTLGGKLGKVVGEAVEHKHVDRKALSIACQLNALSDEKLHVTYIHLMEYLDHLGTIKRALAQGELFEKNAQAAKDTPEDGDDDGKESNVTHIGAAARKTVESLEA